MLYQRRRLTIEGYDSNSFTKEDTIYDLDSITEKFDLRTVRTVGFGPCFTLIPK